MKFVYSFIFFITTRRPACKPSGAARYIVKLFLRKVFPKLVKVFAKSFH